VSRALIVVLVACARPPAPIDVPTRHRHVELAPAPDIAAMAVLARMRDNLSDELAPAISLEPHYPLAEAFGASTWSEVCDLRGALRTRADLDEILAYVHAWCSPDRPTVLDRLWPLVDAHTPGLVAAVREDVVALAASELPARRALELLAQHDIAGNGLVDAYLALSRPEDAAIAMRENPPATDAERCRGAAFAMLRAPVAARASYRGSLAGADPICASLRASLGCPYLYDPSHSFAVTSGTDQIVQFAIRMEAQVCPTVPDIGLISLYVRWPRPTLDAARWRSYAAAFEDLAPDDDALSLVTTALENAARLSCEEVPPIAARWRDKAPATADPAIVHRLDALAQTVCWPHGAIR
jgi:hypothetical protein